MMTQILAQLKQEKWNEEPRKPPFIYVTRGGDDIQFNPKVEFPSFDGTDTRGWIKKCTRYFGLCKILNNQRVDFASLHLKGVP